MEAPASRNHDGRVGGQEEQSDSVERINDRPSVSIFPAVNLILSIGINHVNIAIVLDVISVCGSLSPVGPVFFFIKLRTCTFLKVDGGKGIVDIDVKVLAFCRYRSSVLAHRF